MTQPLVLLVTDNRDERELYEYGLPDCGFRVVSAGALEEIPDAVDRLRPDALVLTLKLGDDRTWAALEALQCGGALKVPGILLTGSIRADAGNRLRARANGCAAFVAKPCTPEELAAIVRAVVAGARGLIVTAPSRFGAGAPADSGDGPS